MKVKNFFRAVFVCSLLGGLAACGGGSHPAPVLGADGQPTGQSVQQPDSPGLLGMFGASLAGNMVGNMLSRPAAPAVGGGYGPAPSTTVNRTVVNRTVIVNNHPAPAAGPAAKPAAPPAAVRPPVISTSPTVRAPTPRTWSSSSSSRSFSSGGSRRR